MRCKAQTTAIPLGIARICNAADRPSLPLTTQHLQVEWVYALSDIQKPLGLATYTLSHTLPEALRDKLPSIEVLEAELGGGLGVGV